MCELFFWSGRHQPQNWIFLQILDSSSFVYLSVFCSRPFFLLVFGSLFSKDHFSINQGQQGYKFLQTVPPLMKLQMATDWSTVKRHVGSLLLLSPWAVRALANLLLFAALGPPPPLWEIRPFVIKHSVYCWYLVFVQNRLSHPRLDNM